MFQLFFNQIILNDVIRIQWKESIDILIYISLKIAYENLAHNLEIETVHSRYLRMHFSFRKSLIVRRRDDISSICESRSQGIVLLDPWDRSSPTEESLFGRRPFEDQRCVIVGFMGAIRVGNTKTRQIHEETTDGSGGQSRMFVSDS